jgi:SAM-dependent methyltransferase
MPAERGSLELEAQRDALVGLIFEKMVGTMEIAALYIGDRLGLYQALADNGPLSAAELASKTDTSERYVREWLEQQAVSGVLQLIDEGDTPRFSLPAGHAEVLLDRDSLSFMAPIARFTMGAVRPLPQLVAAFRSGEGVAYPEYGPDAREGQADANRVMFINQLGSEWLPAIPDVHARLQATAPSRVADIGCGTGWSSISLARAYPNARVDGFDSDIASIQLARANAAEAGVADRVTFTIRDASDPALCGAYDVAIAFECLHDMGRPVQALESMRRLVGDRGSVIIVDERTRDSLEAPGGIEERLFYCWSVLFCLPTGIAHAPSVGTGTVMRPGTLRSYAREAGFTDTQILPIEHDLWRFYRLNQS